MISSNIKEVIDGLTDFEKKQIPYATSLALNNTAEIAMKAVKHKIDKDFDVTASWNKVGGRYGIKKKRATKGKLVVEIFIPDSNTWLDDHEDGNIRGGTQLIPTKYFRKLYPNIKTNRGIKSRAKKLLADKSKNRIFEAKISGDDYIMQRKKGKVNGKRQLRSSKSGRLLKSKKVLDNTAYPLFLIHRTGAKQKERLNFYDTVIRVFSKNLDKEFNKALGYAIRTAK